MRAAAHVIPGYRFTLGITFFYLSMILLIPLAAFLFYASGMGVGKFLAVATELRVVHAYLVSFGTSLAGGGARECGVRPAARVGARAV